MPAPIKLSEDVHPLTTFRNHSAEMLRRMKRQKRAVVLTSTASPLRWCNPSKTMSGCLIWPRRPQRRKAFGRVLTTWRTSARAPQPT